MLKKFILGDCMNPEYGLPSYPDKYFDLAIVDPPYGINASNMAMGQRDTKKFSATKYKKKNWDLTTPNHLYFNELFRVSKIQMVWGGNYFTNYLPPSKNWIIWDKGYHFNMSFSQFEMCWQSSGRGCRKFYFPGGTNGNNNSRNAKQALANARIHPTQKPVALYRWLLENYAQSGQLILDTHVGSASSLIACEQLGFDYVGFEIDQDYYEAAQKRMQKGIQSVITF